MNGKVHELGWIMKPILWKIGQEPLWVETDVATLIWFALVVDELPHARLRNKKEERKKEPPLEANKGRSSNKLTP